MKKLNILAAALLITGAAMAQPNWSVDKAHSSLGFTVSHMMVSEIAGGFKSFDVKITSANDDFSNAVVEFTADANSISTNNDGRDKHLKSPDYFDAEKFNTLTFKSNSFTKVEGKKYKLNGDLTLHGVTKPVTLDVIYNGTIVHPYSKKNVAGFKVLGTLKRSDFGVGADTPAAVVGDEISITANAEFVKG